EAKSRRNANNFYSSRTTGHLTSEHGEAIFLIPPDVLRRFVGNERIYYTLAVFPDSSESNVEILDLPDEARSWVTLSKSFTGRELRRLIGSRTARPGFGVKGDGYGMVDPQGLSWAGDLVKAGASETVAPLKNGPPTSVTPPVSAAPSPTSTPSGASTP